MGRKGRERKEESETIMRSNEGKVWGAEGMYGRGEDVWGISLKDWSARWACKQTDWLAEVSILGHGMEKGNKKGNISMGGLGKEGKEKWNNPCGGRDKEEGKKEK